VRIDAIRLTGYDWPFLDVEVDCGKGTYIRSIARDLGTQLGCGGIVQTLRRTRIGPFEAAHGIGLDTKSEQVKLLPLTTALAGLLQLRIDRETERRFRCGQSIRDSLRDVLETQEIVVVNEGGELVGIGERKGEGIHPVLVLNL
jgi:tRNA pseudouridine55 synthase